MRERSLAQQARTPREERAEQGKNFAQKSALRQSKNSVRKSSPTR